MVSALGGGGVEEPRRQRSTAARRATKAAKAAATDGMTLARKAQKKLDETIKAQGGDQPVVTGKVALNYEKVPAEKAPAKKTARPTKIAVAAATAEEVPAPRPVPIRTDVKGLRAPATTATAKARAFWTVGDALKQLEQGYSLERVVLRTGYSESEIRAVGRW